MKQLKNLESYIKKHFGIDISVEEARSRGQNLIGLFKIIYKPIPKKVDLQNTKKRKTIDMKPI